MTQPITRPTDPGIRATSRGLGSAHDETIIRAVALVDSLPNRGAADELIAPLRPRFARLRPRRPLKLARLLFLPLDPLIVPPQRWRPGSPTIPRTALNALTASIRASLDGLCHAIEASIHGKSLQDADTAARAGDTLWAAAADVLLHDPVSVGWPETGLPAATFAPLARRVGALLEQQRAVGALEAEAAIGVAQPTVEAILPILAAITARNPDALPMMVTLLLARLPHASAVLARAAVLLGRRGEATLRLAGEQAAAVLLDQLETAHAIETRLLINGIAESGTEARRLIGLLRALEDDAPSAERRVRVRQLRRHLEAACRACFSTGFEQDLLQPFLALAAGTAPASTTHLEAVARGLRELETEARVLGGGAHYDTTLRRAAELVRMTAPGRSLGIVQRARLLEILVGLEAALAVLPMGR